VPGSLDESTAASSRPRILWPAGVFTQDVIDTWIAYKRENEIDELVFSQ